MSEWSRVKRADLALAHPVAARVAHVADVHAPLLGAEHGADDGRAHAVVLARARRTLEDLAVGDADARQQAVLFLAEVRVEVERPGDIFVGSRAEELRDGLGGDLRGHVARPVATHAVGHDEEVVLLEHHEGVLVVLALEPDVAQPGRDCPHQGDESSNLEKTFTHPGGCQASRPYVERVTRALRPPDADGLLAPRGPRRASLRPAVCFIAPVSTHHGVQHSDAVGSSVAALFARDQTSRMSFSLCAINVSTCFTAS